MDLFDLVAKITLDSSEYEKGIKEAGGSATSFSSAWKTAGKVAVAAISAAAVAVGGLTKKSVEAYAEYEQLAGGVKKLYGDASDELMRYAEQGYRTAGMSSNKYMELATSFSAALINSLDGDASKAAKQTDVAMRAIADNFNTFGGDIQNIQNAFQGFAKQNYAMLDNLKLGYGGTKTEMERLIADANEYAKANGKAADLSINSFSDIVTAIELIQEKQGIAGTTAREAATTIEGALNTTKAAWDNLVTGFADPDADMGQLMDNLIVAIVGDKEGEGLLNQLIPAVQRAVEGIGKFVEKAVPMLAEKLPSLIESFLPVIIKSAVTLVTSLIQALPDIITTLVQMLPSLITMVVNGITDAITQALPILIQQAPRMVLTLAQGLFQSIGVLISAGRKLISSLREELGNGLVNAGKKALASAKKIPKMIKTGLGNLKNIGTNLIQGLWNGIKSKFDSTVNKVKALAAKLPKAVKKVLGIASPSKVFAELGQWIPAGLAQGIEDNMGVVKDASDSMANATLFTPSGAGYSGYGTEVIKNFTFNVYPTPNQSAKEIAEEVRRLIIKDENSRRKAWA